MDAAARAHRAGGSFFHLRSLPGTTWPAIPTLEGAQVWATYLALERTQWLAPAEIEERQLEQLRTLLRHCYEEVPYYRRVMTEAGIGSKPIEGLSELRRLPLLTRRLYQEHAADIQARSLPRGMEASWSGYTSGTNGVPIRVHRTSRDGIWWNALFLRDLEWSDMDPRGRLASIRLLAMKPDQLPRALAGGKSPWWSPICKTLVESGPSYAMDIRQDPRRQLEWLDTVKPDYLVSLPSNLEYLAGLLMERGHPLPGLRLVQAIGEPLPPAARVRIESGFGVPVKNLYSTTEGGYMASPCPLGHGLHVHAESILAEVLDADGEPVLPGETGRLVFTSLHGFLMPFVRYDILDDVTVASERCPCGRGLPLWKAVDGRRHPLLHLPDGRRKSSMGITLGIRRVGGVRQFQIVQRAPDNVLLRVVPGRDWRPEMAAAMRKVVHEEMEAPITVIVEEQETLERPPGGKLRVVVNELEGPIGP